MYNWKKLVRQAAKPVLFLLTFILICAFLAHYLRGDETLLDYARNNPELAYGTDRSTDQEAVSGAESSTPDQNTDRKPAANESNDPTSSKTPHPSAIEKSTATPDTEEPDTSVTSDNPPSYSESENKLTDSPAPQPEDGISGNTESAKEPNSMNMQIDRTTYKEGFYYEPMTDSVKNRITGISYPENGCTVPYEDLTYVGLLYFDFNGQEQTGELICNKAIAQDMVEIFYELYRNEYQLERVRLIDEYDGDDTASMADNNTSCFNYRVVDGTTHLSKHALGLAIDINPYYNPYVVFGKNADGSDYISPPGSEVYADRSQSFAYKIDENDLCYRLFTEHGFTWGGNWNSVKDYQHFQKTID